MRRSFSFALFVAFAVGLGEACTLSSAIPSPSYGSDGNGSSSPDASALDASAAFDATSDSAATTDAGIFTGDGGVSDSGGTTPVIDAGPFDAGPKALINGCFSFTDNTASGVSSLNWSFGIAGDVNRCSKIAVGQSVTWTGDFATHPLGPYDDTQPGGVPINGDPIMLPASPGGSVTINFPTAGTYGYWCMVHQTLMMGAIQVQ